MNVKIIPKQMGKNPLNGGGERIWAPFLLWAVVCTVIHSEGMKPLEDGGEQKTQFSKCRTFILCFKFSRHEPLGSMKIFFWFP